jgi:hypothetical protein
MKENGILYLLESSSLIVESKKIPSPISVGGNGEGR